MRIDLATPEEIRQVALNMRQLDYQELSALMFADTREEVAEYLVKRSENKRPIVAAIGNVPIAIGDTVETRPNVITLMFFATDELPRVGAPLTRFIKQRLFPQLVNAGVHRIECVSQAGHFLAHTWIMTLGLTQEARCPSYGKRGEDFIQFSWVKNVSTTSFGE